MRRGMTRGLREGSSTPVTFMDKFSYSQNGNIFVKKKQFLVSRSQKQIFWRRCSKSMHINDANMCSPFYGTHLNSIWECEIKNLSMASQVDKHPAITSHQEFLNYFHQTNSFTFFFAKLFLKCPPFCGTHLQTTFGFQNSSFSDVV